jgi:hypothetical protein
VNSKNKATSLKKIILESIGLYKRANIVLFKQEQNDNPEVNKSEYMWVPFSEHDYES